MLNKYLPNKRITIHHFENTEDQPVGGYPLNQRMVGLNRGLNITRVTLLIHKSIKSDYLQPQTRSMWQNEDSNLGPDAQPSSAAETKGTEDRACCSEGTVIWRGRRDRHVKQLVNKITARLPVLYPDIIKYMLYNTIRDKSKAHHTNYGGQRVSKRERQGSVLSQRALEAKGPMLSLG